MRQRLCSAWPNSRIGTQPASLKAGRADTAGLSHRQEDSGAELPSKMKQTAGKKAMWQHVGWCTKVAVVPDELAARLQRYGNDVVTCVSLRPDHAND